MIKHYQMLLHCFVHVKHGKPLRHTVCLVFFIYFAVCILHCLCQFILHLGVALLMYFLCLIWKDYSKTHTAENTVHGEVCVIPYSNKLKVSVKEKDHNQSKRTESKERERGKETHRQIPTNQMTWEWKEMLRLHRSVSSIPTTALVIQ